MGPCWFQLHLSIDEMKANNSHCYKRRDYVYGGVWATEVPSVSDANSVNRGWKGRWQSPRSPAGWKQSLSMGAQQTGSHQRWAGFFHQLLAHMSVFVFWYICSCNTPCSQALGLSPNPTGNCNTGLGLCMGWSGASTCDSGSVPISCEISTFHHLLLMVYWVWSDLVKQCSPYRFPNSKFWFQENMPFPNIEEIQQTKVYVKEIERQNCD